ncbi:MAG: choice-of-anchor V domain-containing protein [Bacteroidia bacterium]
MKTLQYRLLFALCIGIAWLSCALARYGGPGYLMNAAATGAPGEITCSACHAGGSGGGSLQLEIVNGPNGYVPGATYTLHASLQANGAEVGGMQIVTLDGNSSIGQWIAPSGMRAVTVSTFGNAPRDYLEHSAPQQANSRGRSIGF